MNKYDTIAIITNARQAHEIWLESGQILIDGINVDKAEEPVKSTASEFGLWLNTDGMAFTNFPWYKELKVLYEKSHQVYSVLYYESMRMYEPKRFNQLSERFDELQLQLSAFLNKLDDVKADLSRVSDAEFNDLLIEVKPVAVEAESERETKEQQGSVAAEVSNKSELDLIDTIQASSAEVIEPKMETIDINKHHDAADSFQEPEHNISNDFETLNTDSGPVYQRQLLEQQDLIQLEQEKELSQLELGHLKERRKLTQQSVQQLEQYYLLKHQEIEIDQRENKNIEAQKRVEKNLKQQELEELENRKQKQLEEFDQFKVVDQKMQKKKEIIKEQDIYELEVKKERLKNSLDGLSVDGKDLNSSEAKIPTEIVISGS